MRAFFIQISNADVTFLTMGGLVINLLGANLDDYPKLKDLKARVEAVPQIAAWIAKRPVTEM